MTSRERAGLVNRAGASLGKRLRRVRPDLVPGRLRVIVIAVWVAAIAVAIVLVTMDPALITVRVSPGENPLDVYFAPLWFRILLLVVIALLAVTATTITALRVSLGGHGGRRDSALFEGVLAVSLGFPAFALAADQQFALAGAAVLTVVGVEWLAHAPVVTSRTPTAIPAIAGAVALPWLVLLVAQIMGVADTWTWASIFWFAATFAIFGAYYGVVRASAARVRGVQFTRRREVKPVVAWLCIGVVAVLLLARFTVARTVFGESDAALWAPWHKLPMSWAHAALVGSLIAAVAIRSSAKPFRRHGERFVSGVIAGTGVLELALSWVAIVIGMAGSIFTGTTSIDSGFIDWYPIAQLVLMVALAGLVCLPRFRRTAGRAIALTSGVYLIPFLLLVVFISVAPLWVSVTTSVQVCLVLLAIALALAVWNSVSPRRQVAWRVVVRLAVLPFVVVNAGLLLPAIFDWSARYVLIVGAALSLMFFLPQVAADPRRRAHDLLVASGAVLLGLTVALLALPSIFKEASYTAFGTLWLTVTVVTGLVVEREPRLPRGREPIEDPPPLTAASS